MKRIRARVISAMVAGMMTIGGCSDDSAQREPAAKADAASPAPTTPASAPPPAGAPAADTRSPQELIAAGRSTYNANCIACHNMDPRQDGPLGPAIAGSAPELIEARVMRGEYPAGYVPKRDTKVMVPLPHLQAKLPELEAYLGSLQ